MATKTRGSGFETRFMVGGESYSAPFKTKAAGEAWELEQRARLKLGKPVTYPHDAGVKAGDPSAITIKQIVEKCDRHMWTGTDKGALRNGNLFAKWCGPDMLASEALTADRIYEYAEYRQDEVGNQGVTVNRHLSALSKMITMARNLKAIPATQIDLPWFKSKGGRIRFYSHEEETKILGMLIKWSMEDYADLCMFLADTGARLGEAEKLDWADIRGRNISFLETKNGTDRSVYASPRVEAALERLKQRHHNQLGGPFHWLKRHQLRTVWSKLRQTFEWMGPDTVIHTFRHTCATRLAISGKADIYRIKTWMGHKSIATTMRYAHLIPKTMEDLANALDEYNQRETTTACPTTNSSPPSSASQSSSSEPASGVGVRIQVTPKGGEFSFGQSVWPWPSIPSSS